MTQPKIPQTDSIQSLAEFWDSQDVTDFSDELEEVHEPVFETEYKVTVLLKPDESKAVQTLADHLNTSTSDLIHDWVIERLQTGTSSVK